LWFLVDITERKKSRRAPNECAAYFENDEKQQQRAAELSLANTELERTKKKKRAAELINANNELIFKEK
jgi:hypothetical protein